MDIKSQCLLPIDKLLNQTGDVYKVYGAFYRNAKNFKVPKPKKIKTFNFDKIKTSDNIQLNYIDKFYQKNDDILVRGGRKNAQKRNSKVIGGILILLQNK